MNKPKRLLVAGLVLAASVATLYPPIYQSVAFAEEKHTAVNSFANNYIKERVAAFKQNGKDIQSIFKTHMPQQNYSEIARLAQNMATWADQIPTHFPAGSQSKGARPAIWETPQDFRKLAMAHGRAARALVTAAHGTDSVAVQQAARRLGGTCKACHETYRNKK